MGRKYLVLGLDGDYRILFASVVDEDNEELWQDIEALMEEEISRPNDTPIIVSLELDVLKSIIAQVDSIDEFKIYHVCRDDGKVLLEESALNKKLNEGNDLNTPSIPNQPIPS